MKRDNKRSRAEEIIRRIRQEQMRVNDGEATRQMMRMLEEENSIAFREWMEENRPNYTIKSEERSEPFHKFKEILPAVNAMGLYNEIVSELEFENDPERLKEIFRERLAQILEAIPDSMASSISCVIKGLD